MQIDINMEALCELESLHLSVSHYIILKILSYRDTYEYREDFLNSIPENLVTVLVRKKYITKELKLTELGKTFYNILSNPAFDRSSSSIKKEVKKIKSIYSEQFEQWWNLYPTSDTWGSFPGTRSFKVGKEQCAEKYSKLLGTYLQSDLTLALEYEVFIRKDSSRKLAINKLSFMQNTLTYLNQQSFLGYLDMAKNANWVPIHIEELKDQNKTVNTEEMF